MVTEVSTKRGARDNAVRRLLRERRLKHALERYEKYVRIKAREFAQFSHEREDFEQEGRLAVWRAVTALEAKQDGGTHQYFRVAIRQAMIDYSRKVHKRNYAVWEYTGPPPKVERYRYGGELKARIRYHPAKLKCVTYQYEPQRSLDAPRAEPCFENLERDRDERAGSSAV